MRCLNCSNIVNTVENMLISFNPDDFNLSINDSDNTIRCSSCNERILYQDYYLEDDFDEVEEELIYEIAGNVQSKIKSCTNCLHGGEMRDLQASFYMNFKEDDEYERLWDKYNISTEMNELIDENSLIDEEYYDAIIENIRCPICGNGGGAYSKDTIGFDRFNKYSEVYTSRDIESFNESFYGDYKSIRECIKFLDENIPIDEIIAFRDEYINNPVFIYKNNVFKTMYSALKKLYDKKQYITLFPSMRLFRARVSNEGEQLIDEMMWNPPSNKANQGRYNSHGKSILYCSNCIDILRKEVPIKQNEEYNFAVLRVRKTMHVFPVDLIFDDFEGFINDNSIEDSNLKKKYIITNIIQMICEQIGYNGVAYKSVKDRRYVNYAIFNFKRDIDIDMLNVFLDSHIKRTPNEEFIYQFERASRHK